MKIGRSISTQIAAHAAAVDPHADRAYADTEIATAIAPLAHKELFVPVTYMKTPQDVGARLTTAGDLASVFLLFPQDFTTITDIELIFTPLETGADMHLTITTYYGAYNGGESYGAHGETESNRDIGATVNNQNLAHSISDLVDDEPPVAGDLLFVLVAYSATAVDSNLSVKGLRLTYS